MPVDFTLPPDTRAVGSGNPPLDMDGVVDALTAAGAGLNVLNAAFAGGADPANTADSTAAIQGALNAASPGHTVTMPPGTYKTTAPLTIPPGVILRGAGGNVLSGTAYGTVIRPSAAWAQGTAPSAAVILLLNQTDGAYSGPSEEQHLRDLMIDGTSLAVTADGIQGYGQVNDVLIENVMVSHVTGNGVSAGVSAHAASPQAWFMRRVTAYTCGHAGFSLTGADMTLSDCYALGNGTAGTFDGFTLGTCSNSKLTSCRSEWSLGNGYHWTPANNGNGSGSVSFIGCSTDHNNLNGILVDGGTGFPVIISAGYFRRDGYNGNSGGGGYAAIAFSGFHSAATISACTSYPGLNDAGGGVLSPQYGLSVQSCSSAQIAVTGSIIWGATSALNYDSSAAGLSFTTGCQFVTGAGNAAVYATPAGGLAEWGGHEMGYAGQAFDALMCDHTGTRLITAGTLNLIGIQVRYPQTVSKIRLRLLTNGATLTSGQCLAGLYSPAGTLLGFSADQSAVWNTGAPKTVDHVLTAQSTGSLNLLPGMYWATILGNGTTMPSFDSKDNTAVMYANGALAAAASRYAANGTSLTALPSSFTPSSNTATQIGWWAALI